MLVPASCYKEEIEKAFAKLAYTDKLMWYDGCIDNFHHELTDESDKYHFAIVENNTLLGYISFRMDWYCSMAYNFGLMSFTDTYADDNDFYGYKSTKPAIFKAIREVIRMVESFNPHRIDWRCVGGNPAARGYLGILKLFEDKYDIARGVFRDNMKDRHGNYHDTIMFEMIKKN